MLFIACVELVKVGCMNEINEIADRLKEVRKKSGKRQQPFADSILVSQSAYSAYEHAKREIPMKVLRSLVIEYNVNPAWFLLGTGNFSYLPEAG